MKYKTCHKFKLLIYTYCEDFSIDGHINGGFVVIVIGKQIRSLGQEELQTLPMPILGTKMAWCVTVYVFGIDVCTVLY